jgi:hypothetical protein
MKVRKGRTYLNGEERDTAVSALEDRAYQILGRLMAFPPAKRPPRKGKATEPVKRKIPPRITGTTAWCPSGLDGPGIPVELDSKATKKQIKKDVEKIAPDGPMADDLRSFLLEANELRNGILKVRAPAVFNAWFEFLMSVEGTKMAGVPIPEEPLRSVTLPDGRIAWLPPPHHPPSDEAIISITWSLLYDMKIKMKHSILRQYLVRFHKAEAAL